MTEIDIRDRPHDDLWIDPLGRLPLLKNQMCPVCHGDGMVGENNDQPCSICKGQGKGT